MIPNLGVVCDTSMILVVVYVAVMLWVLIFVSGFARIICITFVFFISSVLLLLVGTGLFGEKVEINSTVVEKGKELAVVERQLDTQLEFKRKELELKQQDLEQVERDLLLEQKQEEVELRKKELKVE